MSRLFLSHSSSDNFEARALADWLEAEGWPDVFLDILPERGIAAGQRWERALHQAANRCEAVVFLVSRAWLASGWCRKEYELARRLGKRLFAVVIERGLRPADLPPELTDAWQVTDLAAGDDHDMFRVKPPGSEEERHVLFSRAGLDRLRAGLKQAGLDANEFAWPPEGAKNPAPYVGLRALGQAEAGLFFGRDADLVRALDWLRGFAEAAAPRIVAILGASGAGKSSFLAAGLLPRLRRDDSRFLVIPAIRPGRAAIDGETGLVSALNDAMTGPHARADIRSAIACGAEGVRDLLAPLAEAAKARTLADRSPVVVIAIDQAEELFGAEGDGATLLDLLAELVREDAPAVMLLFAIRSDAYEALERAKPLEGLRQETLPLPPMPRNAARAVIEGPAARYRQSVAKLDLDPRLTQSLLDDLDRGGGRDALPLLAFTLERLWREYGRSGALTLPAYETFGGLAGAIEAGVQRVFAEADKDPRIPRDEAARLALMRRGLVPWLAGIDPDTKAPRRNVARAADIPEEARPLIDLMVEERLLSRSVDEAKVVTLEPAHEALLRQWGKLKGWLDEDFALLAALEAVQRASRDWDANARGEAWLAHRGQRLAEAGALDARPDLAAKFSAQDREYLAACRASEEAARAEAERVRAEREAAQARALADAQAIAAANRRVAQRTGVGAAAAVVLALAAGGAAVYAKRQADFAGEQQRVAVEQKEIAEKEAERATTQEAEAEKQKVVAERNFEAAKTTVDGLIFDIAQGMANLQGIRLDTIRRILETTRQTVDRLLASEPEDRRLLASKAVMLYNFGVTYLAAGDLRDAMAAATEGLDIRRKLATSYPNDEQTQRGMLVGLYILGDVKYQAGDQTGALAAYQEGGDIARKLAALNPLSSLAQRDLSLTLSKLGDAMLRAGDHGGAVANYQESFDICRKLAAVQPNSAQALRDVSVSLSKLGDAKLQAGDEAGAIEAYQISLDNARNLAADFSDAQAQRDVSVSLVKLADVRLRQGDRQRAISAYQESLDIARKLAAADPGNVAAKTDVVINLLKISQTGYQAAQYLREALAILAPLDRDGLLPPDKKGLPATIEKALINLAPVRNAPPPIPFRTRPRPTTSWPSASWALQAATRRQRARNARSRSDPGRTGSTGTGYLIDLSPRQRHDGLMARLSRVVVPEVPHHVTQRGNRRQAIFSEPGDYALYRDLLAERCDKNGVVCWAYCLMPNHVHLILNPGATQALSRTVGEAHRRYTGFVNARARETGHLFQGRFGCVAMDEAHCLTAVRYLALNPVRAGLCAAPEAWPWSSVRAHLAGRDDALVRVKPLLDIAPRFGEWLQMSASEQAEMDAFETLSANGRPLGGPAFIAAAEAKLRRTLAKRKPGPKRVEDR